MKTAIQRRQTAFRLSETLLEDLKIKASQCNRSLNNLVESILMQALYDTPNSDTVSAIEETKSGKYAGVLDMKDFNAFLKSIDSAQ